MATSKRRSTLSDEIACPVCFEEFLHPKCLSSCAHNVCQRCLEIMVSGKKKVVECPICREVTKLPSGGVDALPTNTLLVRLVDRAKTTTTDAQRVQQIMGLAMEVRLDARRKGDEVKEKIKDETNAFTAAIRKREQKLCSKVDDLVKVYEKQVPFYQIQRATEKPMDVANEALMDKVDKREIDSLLLKIQKLQLDETDAAELARAINIPTFNLEFEVDKSSSQKFLKKFGTLQTFLDHGKEGLSDSLATKDKVPWKIEVVKTITAADLGETSFTPYAVTLSEDLSQICILDDELNRVHNLTDKGNQIRSFSIKFGDLYDLTFVGTHFIYVVNRSHKSIIRYFRNGRYCSPYITVPALSDNPSASFTGISTTPGDHLLVSVEALDDSRILICDFEGRVVRSFGQGILQCPRKVLSYDGEYFVCDRDLGCVKVFDCKGSLTREFGEDLESPRGLAIDGERRNVLVSDPGSNTIHVYKIEGTFLTKFETEAPPVSIAMLRDGNVIVCYHDELHCARIVSYTKK